MTRPGRSRAAGATTAAELSAATSRPATSRGPGPAAILYAENHSALSWPLLTLGLCLPSFALAAVIAAALGHSRVFYWTALAIFLITFLGLVVWGLWIPYLRPAAIRLDTGGVRIGGVRWAERHPGRVRRRAAIVPRQYSQVFGCPWTGVLSIGVTTDRQAMKVMRRSAHRGLRLTPLGNLAAPFMRGALVIRVDLDQAQLPSIRPATNWMWSSFSARGFHQPLWVVPTRHHAQLNAALATLPLPSGTLPDPGLDVPPGAPVPDWDFG